MTNKVLYDISKPMYIVYVDRDPLYIDNIYLAWQVFHDMCDRYLNTISIRLVDGQTSEVIEDNEDDE